MPGWTIYYDDGSKVEVGCNPVMEKPPPRGVQVIVPRGEKWQALKGSDYFVWRNDLQQFVGVDLFGLFDFLMDTGLVLFGRMLPG